MYYCVIEKELLAIVLATAQFLQYLYGRKFKHWKKEENMISIYNVYKKRKVADAPSRVEIVMLQ